MEIKTVQDLVDILEKVEDKSEPISVDISTNPSNSIIDINVDFLKRKSIGLKLVVVLFGDYDNDYIRNIVKHNIDVLNPESISFWNLDDLSDYSKKIGNNQFFIALEEKKYNIIAEAARLSILLEQPNTIYVDVDMILNNSIVDLIKNNPDKDIIWGWRTDNNYVSACSGTFMYHGFTDGKALREYYSYFNSDKYDKNLVDVGIFELASNNKISVINDKDSNFIGQWDDLFITDIYLGLHINLSMLFYIKNIFPNTEIGYISEQNYYKSRYYNGLVFVLYEVESDTYNRRPIEYSFWMESSHFFRPLPYVKGFKQDLIDFLKSLFPNINNYDN